MEIKRAAIKHNAKLLIAQTKPSPILVILVYLLIDTLLLELSYRISGMDKLINDMTEEIQKGNLQYIPQTPALSGWAYVLLAALAVMGMLLLAGLTVYCLEICQQRKGGVGNLFDGFTLFAKVIGLFIVQGIFIYLWSLLLIIPGIIAAYRYRQALYLLLENPDYGILECLSRSSRMMTGHKGELFMLDLSFLGWYLFSYIPGAVVWVEPYTRITYTNYYLALRDMPQSAFDATV